MSGLFGSQERATGLATEDGRKVRLCREKRKKGRAEHVHGDVDNLEHLLLALPLPADALGLGHAAQGGPQAVGGEPALDLGERRSQPVKGRVEVGFAGEEEGRRFGAGGDGVDGADRGLREGGGEGGKVSPEKEEETEGGKESKRTDCLGDVCECRVLSALECA